MKNVILIGVILSLLVGLTPIHAGASQKAPERTQQAQPQTLKEFLKKEKQELKAFIKKNRPAKRTKTELVINGFAKASLICGIGSVLMLLLTFTGAAFLSFLWFYGALAAIVLGIIGLYQVWRYYDEFTGEQLAIAGIIIGSLALVIPFLLALFVLILFF